LFEDLVRRTVHGRKLDRILDDNGYSSAGRGKKAPELISEFLHFVDDYPNRPFFSYLCFMDVNQAGNDRKFNHSDKGHVRGSDIASAYDRGLSKLDGQLNDLFAALQQRGRMENTLVILTSDHGNSFSAENPGDHNPDDHGTSLYREQVEVPLFVVLPGKVPGGVRVSRTVSIRQIPATIMYLLNIRDDPFSGDPLPVTPNLVVEPEDRNPCVPAVLNIYTRRAYESIVCGHWQYIRNLKVKDKQAEELFDFRSDPWEENNLAETPEALALLAQMRNQLDQVLVASDPFGRVR
jgi:arylsulfatase A-like enzyme